jgi:siroheme synthase
MGAGEAGAISSALMAAGKPRGTPLVIVENASLPDARRFFGTLGTLESVAASGSGGPALILLGEVYRGSAIINAWYKKQSFGEQLSCLPTARAIRSGRGRSSSS